MEESISIQGLRLVWSMISSPGERLQSPMSELKLDVYHQGGQNDSELLKSFRSDIQDSHNRSHLETLQTTSPPFPYIRLN